MGAEVIAAHRSDQQLVDAVRAGSEPAFEVLFNRHHGHVLAFCRHMLGSREEAEDAVQQTFLTAYREIARGEQPRALRSWLCAIARHRCLSALRDRRRRSVEALPERGGDHLLAQVSTREDLRAVLADVARLPFDQRAALVLAELGDTSHDEIARIVGCPREKVKALVYQARSSLAAERSAREISCADVQEQLSTLRGGALRRGVLRRHLHDCPGCRAFRDMLRVRRRRLGLLWPGAPLLGLKRAVLGTLFGSGGGAGGAALTAGGAGLAVTALVTLAVPGGPLAADGTASGDAREPARPVAMASASGRTAAPARVRAPRVGPSLRPRARRAVRTPVRSGTGHSQPSARATHDVHPAASQPPSPRDRASDAAPGSTPEPPAGDRQVDAASPSKPVDPSRTNRRVTPSRPNRPLTPATPAKANPPTAPGKPPKAPGVATPPGQHRLPPAAAPNSAPAPAPAPGSGAQPLPAGRPLPDAPGGGGAGQPIRPSRPRP